MRDTAEAIKQAAAETRSVIEADGRRQKANVIAKLEELDAKIRVCLQCPLHQSRTLAVPGEGKATAKVMIIGEGPGRNEDQTGRPFIGSSGKFLDHILEGSDLERTD